MKGLVIRLMAAIVVATLLGCATSKQLTLSEAKSYRTSSNYLILHTPQKNYKLVNYSFLEDTLRGRLQSLQDAGKYRLHVYVNSANNLNIDGRLNQNVQIATNDIYRVIYKEESVGKTLLAATIGSAGFIFLIGIISLSLSPWHSFSSI